MRVVFLDRASLKAKVRKLAFESEYVEHEKTAPGEIVPRLAQAAVAIINKVPMRAETLRSSIACGLRRRKSAVTNWVKGTGAAMPSPADV